MDSDMAEKPRNDNEVEAFNGDNDDENDGNFDEPAFVDPKETVEVQVDEENIPMEEMDEDQNDDQEMATQLEHEDMAKVKLQSHDGPVYAVASYLNESMSMVVVSGGGDDRAFLYKVSPGNPPETLPLSHEHMDSVACVAINTPFVTDDLTKTPKLVAVGGYDGAIVLYNPDDGTKVKELEGPSDVECLSFHPKGGTVLLAGSVADGTLWMYHIPTSKCMQVFVGHESGVSAASFTPDGRWALSASSDGTLRIWAPRTGMSKHVFRLSEDGAGLTCLAIKGGADGQLAMVGAEDGKAHVCHIGTKKVVATLQHWDPPAQMNEEETENNTMSVEAVAFASAEVNANWCATGGTDGRIKVWDLGSNGQCRQICHAVGEDSFSGGITRIQWHPKLPLLFASSSDGAVRIWDARSGTLLESLFGHTDMINDLAVNFLENSTVVVLVSGGDDKTVRVFETDVGRFVQGTSALVEAGQGKASAGL